LRVILIDAVQAAIQDFNCVIEVADVHVSARERDSVAHAVVKCGLVLEALEFALGRKLLHQAGGDVFHGRSMSKVGKVFGEEVDQDSRHGKEEDDENPAGLSVSVGMDGEEDLHGG
jgi:hypothetical protein